VRADLHAEGGQRGASHHELDMALRYGRAIARGDPKRADIGRHSGSGKKRAEEADIAVEQRVNDLWHGPLVSAARFSGGGLEHDPPRARSLLKDRTVSKPKHGGNRACGWTSLSTYFAHEGGRVRANPIATEKAGVQGMSRTEQHVDRILAIVHTIALERGRASAMAAPSFHQAGNP
jgi:hypothetical protein